MNIYGHWNKIMNLQEKYSPGVNKLIHHMDHLKSILESKPIAPLHVSVWPTLRCQCKCSYCCCRNTVDRNVKDLDINKFIIAIDALSKYGTKAIEFSGGGEPLLWMPLNESVKYIKSKDIKLSLISNGLLIDKVPEEILKVFSWIRISLQSIKHAESIDFDKISKFTKISASYIVGNDISDLSIIESLYNFAKNKKIVIRIAIQRPNSLDRENLIGNCVDSFGDPIFFSWKAANQSICCYMAWIRAAIDWRGKFLPCPAMQLSSESEGKIPNDFSLCNIEDLEKWILDNPPRDLGYKCQFCNCGKEHNDFIYNCLKEIPDAEFV